MGKVRVIYELGGSIGVVYPVVNSRRFHIDPKSKVDDFPGNPFEKQEILKELAKIITNRKCRLALDFEKRYPRTFIFETEVIWLDRVFTKAMRPQYDEEGIQVNPLCGRPYDNIDSSELPQSREDRDAWTGEKGKGVFVDQVKTAKLREDKELEEKIREKLREMAIKEIEKEKI